MPDKKKFWELKAGEIKLEMHEKKNHQDWKITTENFWKFKQHGKNWDVQNFAKKMHGKWLFSIIFFSIHRKLWLNQCRRFCFSC